MNNKLPIYLAKVDTSFDGVREFVRESIPYTEKVWGTPYNRFFFKLRKTYLDTPNCNFNCPSGRKFFCCYKCFSHSGYFEWKEILFFSEEEKEQILSLWNNGTGFLGEDGCILPRKLRSLICLAFVCRHSKTKG